MANTEDRHQLVQRSQHDKKRNDVKATFKEAEQKVSVKRAMKKSCAFEVASQIARAATKREKERGVDVPPGRAGLAQFGQLRKTIYAPWVKGELAARGLVEGQHFQASWGITKLRGLLKVTIGGEDGPPFRAVTEPPDFEANGDA